MSIYVENPDLKLLEKKLKKYLIIFSSVGYTDFHIL